MRQDFPASFAPLFDRAYEEITRSTVIALAGHKNPDGDAVGSMLALAQVLETMPGKYIISYLTDPVPESLRFIPHSEKIRSSIPWYPDLIIGFDYGDIARLGIPPDYQAGARMITFDHHPPHTQRGEVRIIDTSSSSTAELLYLFMRYHRIPINADIALCLLTGIFTDSGGFLHSNTTQRTLRIAGELLESGVSLDKIRTHTLSSKSPKVLNCWGDILIHARQERDLGMMYAGFPFSDFQKYGISLDDLSGVVNILNGIADTKFCALLIEHKEGRVRGSLRSEPFKGVDVSAIAKRLGGGGHKYAAGFDIEGDLGKAEENLRREVITLFQ